MGEGGAINMSNNDDLDQSSFGPSGNGDDLDQSSFVNKPIPQISWSDIPLKMWQNAVPDGIQTVNSIATSLLHPLDTINGLSDTAVGGIVNGGRALFGQGFTMPYADPQAVNQAVATADKFGQQVKDSVGSVDAVKNSIAYHPVQSLMALSAVLGGGSGLAKGAGAVADSLGATDLASGAATAAKYLGNASTYTDPIAGPVSAVGWGLGKLLDPLEIYRKQLKPSLMTPDRTQNLLQTAVDNKISPDTAGYWKNEGLINQYLSPRNQLISDSASQGVGAPVAPFADAADPIINGVAPTDKSVEGAIDFKNGFLERNSPWFNSLGWDSFLPVDKLEELKEKTAALANYDTSHPTYNPATNDAIKAVAGAIRDKIAELVPGVSDYNQQMAPLIDLKDQLIRAANRNGNASGGITAPLVTTAAGAAGAGPVGSLAAGIGAKILGLNRANIAFGLNDLKNFGNTVPYVPGMLTRYPYMANKMATPNGLLSPSPPVNESSYQWIP